MNAPNAEFAAHFAGGAPFGGRAWPVPRATFTPMYRQPVPTTTTILSLR
jgi:hypothetical protein